MGVGQLMMMPLFFASNAIYPIAIMLPWLQILSRLNPLTYFVDALRNLMLVGSVSSYSLLTDFADWQQDRAQPLLLLQRHHHPAVLRLRIDVSQPHPGQFGGILALVGRSPVGK
jgi:hypothetical protein